ncbi:MAG: hypothetical protein GPOALKHO_000714 [Sodalis sp.]|uniref:hypothetical protein n=1 Tax=Sodalis sp. (in: enterobacteria) TaxID=1898979 RepID=UPI0038736D27|nr:MAG: hypothetical protein GPOALKHO_000714 [Sodalis sp.]
MSRPWRRFSTSFFSCMQTFLGLSLSIEEQNSSSPRQTFTMTARGRRGPQELEVVAPQRELPYRAIESDGVGVLVYFFTLAISGRPAKTFAKPLHLAVIFFAKSHRRKYSLDNQSVIGQLTHGHAVQGRFCSAIDCLASGTCNLARVTTITPMPVISVTTQSSHQHKRVSMIMYATLEEVIDIAREKFQQQKRGRNLIRVTIQNEEIM